jgi:hypothetical protein
MKIGDLVELNRSTFPSATPDTVRGVIVRGIRRWGVLRSVEVQWLIPMANGQYRRSTYRMRDLKILSAS